METMMNIFRRWSGQVHRIVLSLCVFLFMGSGIARAGVEVVIDSIRYQLDDDGTASVVKHKPYYGYKYDGHLVIPGSVEYGGKVYVVDGIAANAFYYCRELLSVTIPSSIEVIGKSAFEGCSNMDYVNVEDIASWCNIKFEDSLANPLYGHSLYMNGQEVKSLDIPEGLTSIGDYAFCGFYDLVSLTLPSSITEIGNGAFLLCRGLTSLTLPNGLTSIGDAAFRSCASLKTVTIPQSVKSIGRESFYLCSSLTSVNILSPDVKMGADPFRDCTVLEDVSLPEGLEELPVGCFSRCYSLQRIILPQSLRQMGASCFRDCRALLSIRLPQNIKRISVGCFNGCSQLRRVVVLSEDECVLEEGCFFNCNLLNDFVIHATTPPERKEGKYYIYSDNWVMVDDQFYTPYGGGKKNLYVPAESIEDYRSSDLWGQWENIMPLEEFLDDDDELHEDIHPSSDGKYTYRGLYYTLDEEEGAASVAGVIDSYFYYPSPAISDGRLEVTKVLIPERVSYKGKVYPVTSIGDRCFYEYRNLCSLTIPSTVKSLGAGCFVETGLSSVILPEGLESIGAGCFEESRLTSIDIPSSVTYIGDGCFLDSYWLTNVILRSKKLDYLGAGCFNADNLSQFVCYAEDVPQFEHEMWGRTYTPFLNGTISEKGSLYVRKELVDAYRASEDWKGWKEILPLDEYQSPDGIATVEGEKNADVAIIYDLQGRRVQTPQRGGLYIRGGRKFVCR